jgi:hypothetical protein
MKDYQDYVQNSGIGVELNCHERQKNRRFFEDRKTPFLSKFKEILFANIE